MSYAQAVPAAPVLSIIALDEALSAPEPHPRSPAFAVQAVYRLGRAAGWFPTREDFLCTFPFTSERIYKGKLSWNYAQSCWQLADGPHVDCSRIEADALRWYVEGRDFSRHTRDSKFSYPEDTEVVAWQHGEEKVYTALMPLAGEMTRRLFIDPSSDSFGYCDVHRADKVGQFDAVLGFFYDTRTHGVVRSKLAPFWELEGAIIPAMLKGYRILRYDVLPLSAKRGA